MIRHICLFKFKDEAGGRTREQNVMITKNMLDKLPESIEYIRAQQTFVGAEAQSADNCDLILISDFDSLDALEKYKKHPAHVAVGDFMRPVRISRSCIDFNV